MVITESVRFTLFDDGWPEDTIKSENKYCNYLFCVAVCIRRTTMSDIIIILDT